MNVYPPTYAQQPDLAGYELPIGYGYLPRPGTGRIADPRQFQRRGPGYRFRLPTVNYEFKPGDRIMVQVQSSLFPLYDRNPQTFVNIFLPSPRIFARQRSVWSTAHRARARYCCRL